MAPSPDLIAVARVTRPQGRRGELRLLPLTDDPARLRDLVECFLVPPVAGARHEVEAVRFQGPTPVIKLRGVESLHAAEALVGRLVSIPRAAARPLPPDRFYAFDLVGATVRDAGGTSLGTLEDVLPGDAHDLWVLRAGRRECLIPAVAAIVERVDLVERLVVIHPPEGLLDLAEEPDGARDRPDAR
jgi:16S rRNA processing protein RimM